jgi:hypothetical protein
MEHNLANGMDRDGFTAVVIFFVGLAYGVGVICDS